MTKTVEIDRANTQKELTAGWRWVRLGEVCKENTGVRDPRSSPDKTFRYVDITSVDNVAKRIVEPKTFLGSEAPSRARNVIRAGDVIVSTTRPNLNAVALVPPDLDEQICSTGFCVLRTTSDLDPSYLFAFAQSADFVLSLSGLVKGALYPAVTDKQVRAQVIPLPPLAEQKRIAAILNEQMAAVERARAAARVQLEAAKALPAAHLRTVFNSPQAQQWPRRRVGELCERDCQIVDQGSRLAADRPYLSLEHIESGTGRILRQPYEAIEDEGQSTTFAFDSRHILYGKLRPYLNKVALPDFEGRCTTELIPLLPRGTDRRFLTWLLRRQETVDAAMRGKTGSRMPRANMDDLLALQIPLPPIAEQQRIAEALTQQMAVAERTRKTLEAQLDTINKMPSALLRCAFSGNI